MTTKDRFNEYIDEIMFFIPKSRIDKVKRSWKRLPEPQILLDKSKELFNQESLKIEKTPIIKASKQLLIRQQNYFKLIESKNLIIRNFDTDFNLKPLYKTLPEGINFTQEFTLPIGLSLLPKEKWKEYIRVFDSPRCKFLTLSLKTNNILDVLFYEGRSLIERNIYRDNKLTLIIKFNRNSGNKEDEFYLHYDNMTEYSGYQKDWVIVTKYLISNNQNNGTIVYINDKKKPDKESTKLRMIPIERTIRNWDFNGETRYKWRQIKGTRT